MFYYITNYECNFYDLPKIRLKKYNVKYYKISKFDINILRHEKVYLVSVSDNYFTIYDILITSKILLYLCFNTLEVSKQIETFEIFEYIKNDVLMCEYYFERLKQLIVIYHFLEYEGSILIMAWFLKNNILKHRKIIQCHKYSLEIMKPIFKYFKMNNFKINNKYFKGYKKN